MWSAFREEVLLYQLRLGTALCNLPDRQNLPKSRPSNTPGAFLRILLFLPGLIIVLARRVLRWQADPGPVLK